MKRKENEKNEEEKKQLHEAEVLLVEDNKLQQVLITKGLQGIGFNKNNITVLDDGKIAVDFFTSNPEKTFDLIITDQNMPNMNGNLFITQLREQGYSGVIIGNSSAENGIEHSGEAAKELMLEAGADGFYDKSHFVGNKLKATMDDIVANHLPYINNTVGKKLQMGRAE